MKVRLTLSKAEVKQVLAIWVTQKLCDSLHSRKQIKPEDIEIVEIADKTEFVVIEVER